MLHRLVCVLRGGSLAKQGKCPVKMPAALENGVNLR